MSLKNTRRDLFSCPLSVGLHFLFRKSNVKFQFKDLLSCLMSWCFTSVYQRKCHDGLGVIQIKQPFLPFTFYLIHYILIIVPFHGVNYELMRASLNKKQMKYV